MVIRNISNPRVVRNTTKELWDKMPPKYKKLFEVVDPNDPEPSKEISVSNAVATENNQAEKTVPDNKNNKADKTPPDNGEKKKKKEKNNTQNEKDNL